METSDTTYFALTGWSHNVQATTSAYSMCTSSDQVGRLPGFDSRLGHIIRKIWKRFLRLVQQGCAVGGKITDFPKFPTPTFPKFLTPTP